MIDWRSLDDIAAGRLGLPATVVARAAEELCRRVSEPFLANHQLRSYLWASLLGGARRIEVDHESLFVAAALHDVGLTDDYRDTGCFEVTGGKTAEQFLWGQGWPAERAAEVRRAIILHVEQSVPIEDGAIAHVLDLGISVDVTGRRLDEIDPDDRAMVLDVFPRLDFKRQMTDLLRRDAAAHPGCATAMWFDELDLAGRIAEAGFDS